MVLSKVILLFSALLLSGGSLYAQDITNLGGDLTADLPAHAAITLPSPNVTSQERFNLHLDGFVAFNHSFFSDKDAQGRYVLGPRFNNQSCNSCHVGDGKGLVGLARNTTHSSMIVKVSLRGMQSNGQPRDVTTVGEQLQDHTRRGQGPYKLNLAWKEIRGYFPDRHSYRLRKPKLTFRIPSISKDRMKRVVSSLRMAPSVIGMGLLEAVSSDTLIAMSDPDDQNRDGISGRVRYVINRATGLLDIGRFGFRASQPTIAQQTGAALFNDMGLTNSLFQGTSQTPEVSDTTFDKIVLYQQFPGVHKAKNQDDPDVVAGKLLFQSVGCSNCHMMTLTTGDSSVPEVAHQVFHPFTDLLLHDMGSDLADTRPEMGASAREWRTTPLWGLGISRELSAVAPRYLHDGRARDLNEAILWHGGEARRAREAFKFLSRAERDQLIKFLSSL